MGHPGHPLYFTSQVRPHALSKAPGNEYRQNRTVLSPNVRLTEMLIVRTRGVMILALELDFQLFGDLGSSKKQNRDTYIDITIPTLDPDPVIFSAFWRFRIRIWIK